MRIRRKKGHISFKDVKNKFLDNLKALNNELIEADMISLSYLSL